MSKNISTLIVLTFVLVLGLYAAGIWFYTKNKSTIDSVSSGAGVLDSVINVFTGKAGRTK